MFFPEGELERAASEAEYWSKSAAVDITEEWWTTVRRNFPEKYRGGTEAGINLRRLLSETSASWLDTELETVRSAKRTFFPNSPDAVQRALARLAYLLREAERADRKGPPERTTTDLVPAPPSAVQQWPSPIGTKCVERCQTLRTVTDRPASIEQVIENAEEVKLLTKAYALRAREDPARFEDQTLAMMAAIDAAQIEMRREIRLVRRRYKPLLALVAPSLGALVAVVTRIYPSIWAAPLQFLVIIAVLILYLTWEAARAIHAADELEKDVLPLLDEAAGTLKKLVA